MLKPQPRGFAWLQAPGRWAIFPFPWHRKILTEGSRSMIEYEGYRVATPDALETPAMLVYDECLQHNIDSLCRLVEGGHHLLAHVKTHKSGAVTERQLKAGMAGFKCATLNELEMVLDCGAHLAVLAYPLAQARKVERLIELVQRFGDARVHACVSAPEHIDLLQEGARQAGITLSVLLDVDVGMHRTGIALNDAALDLYRGMAASQELETGGLHVYDGHEHIVDPAERLATTQKHIEAIQAFRARLEAEGLAAPLIVGGGSFSFLAYARTEGMYGSPGTNVYWDWGYSRQMPDMPFRWAALILTQVIDRYPEQQLFTTDLGYKAICGDPPLANRVRLLGYEDAELQLQNEEHASFRREGELPAVGTYLLAVPGHICPTTIRYPGSYLLDEAGEVMDFYPHTARDRL